MSDRWEPPRVYCAWPSCNGLLFAGTRSFCSFDPNTATSIHRAGPPEKIGDDYYHPQCAVEYRRTIIPSHWWAL
jgi:hypothetical protein